MPWKPQSAASSRNNSQHVDVTVRQYLAELEHPMEKPVHEQDQVSTTDPDSTYATKGGTPVRVLRQLRGRQRQLRDRGRARDPARMSQETVAAREMLTRFTQWQG